MSLWKMAWRSIQQRSLASTLTAFSMALGVTMVVAVLVISAVVAESFRNNSSLGYNIVISAKGGKLQAVLNTVYYLSSPVENVPYSFYKEFKEGQFAPWVEHAIPVCLGDYLGDFRVIGTTPAMFNDLQYAGGKKYEFAQGRNFKQNEFFGGVVGSRVAHELSLKVGDKFEPSHGVPDGHKHDPFIVKGVLAPTGTPNDRAVFVNMEGFYLLEGHAKPEKKTEKAKASAGDDHHHDEHHAHENKAAHDKEHEEKHCEKGHDAEHSKHDHHDADHADDDHGNAHAKHDHHEHKHAKHDHHDHAGDEHHHEHKPLPESQREVTAILVALKSFAGAPPELYAQQLVQTVNEGSVGQAILPVKEITMLFDDLVWPVQVVLIVMTVLIVIVSGVGILVSIYNSMSDRRHEIAVMRALGAGRGTVMLIVLLESILLSLGGGLAGWLLGHALTVALNPWITPHTGVSMGLFQLVPYELYIIPGLILLASLVGYLPAMTAYRTDVAKALSATP